MEEALKKIIIAWDVLPEGHYGMREIEDWLVKHMAPAITNARKVLKND